MCQKSHENCLPYYVLQQAGVYITMSATVIQILLTTTLCVLMDSVRVFPLVNRYMYIYIILKTRCPQALTVTCVP